MDPLNNKLYIEPKAVSEDFCFRIRPKSVVKAREALSRYREGLKEKDKWLEEQSAQPFFLDTCVLLNLYDISSVERDAFVQFLQKNKQRMIIPSLVEREYMRHRIPRIRGFKARVAGIKTEVQSFIDKLLKTNDNIIGGINGVLNRNIVKYGMPNVTAQFKGLLNHMEQSESLKEQQEKFKKFKETVIRNINEECEKCCKDADFEYNDPILEAISETNILPSLSNEEKDYIVELYKNLRAVYDAKEGDLIRGDVTFPGSGDKEKPVDGPIEESVAWGDLYIYHEILNYMRKMNTDAVFLTRDVTKEDWLKKDKTPFVHYIINAYEMTGHLMYIMDADDYIPLSFDSIAEELEDTDEIPENLPVIIQPSEANSTGNGVTELHYENNDEETGKWFEEDFGTIEPLDLEMFGIHLAISPEAFMNELRKSVMWATSYGAGYVSERYFIYHILKNKNYDYESSKLVLSKLIDEGKVERVQEIHDDRTISCLKIKEGIE